MSSYRLELGGRTVDLATGVSQNVLSFVMAADEVAAYCAGHPETWACVVVGYGDVRVYNPDVLAGA